MEIVVYAASKVHFSCIIASDSRDLNIMKHVGYYRKASYGIHFFIIRNMYHSKILLTDFWICTSLRVSSWEEVTVVKEHHIPYWTLHYSTVRTTIQWSVIPLGLLFYLLSNFNTSFHFCTCTFLFINTTYTKIRFIYKIRYFAI